MTEWNLGDLFELVVDAVPDREAVVEGGRPTTFGQLDERVNRAAARLSALGLTRGDHMGVLLRNRCSHLELLLAAFKLGVTPFNVHDRYTTEELRGLFDHARPALVVHEPDLADRLDGAVDDHVQTMPVDAAYDEAVATGPAPRPSVERDGDDRYVLYTGGTTGCPRGVVWRHGDLFVGALGTVGGDEPPPATAGEVADRARVNRLRLLPASPLNHGAAQWSSLAALLGGGTVVLEWPFQPAQLWSTIERDAVTTLVIVGDAFARPLADALAAEPDRWDLSGLLSIVSGGALLSAGVRQELLALLPWIAVVDGYGASETGGVGHSVAWPGQPDPGTSRFHVGPLTAVLDEGGAPVPPGSGRVGFVAHSGAVPVGYHGDDAATARSFPVIDGVRWALPGDLATVEADGTMHLLGRGASSINSGGEKVSPDEVESVLKSHPDVFDAVVLGVADDRWGERVVAVVQPRSGATPEPDALAAHCRTELADFKVPRQVVLVDAVERLQTGKADIGWARAVVDRHADRSPSGSSGYRSP
ncbi:MAG: AMP-binding protein [Acidimicrobiia bacterium]|nr:AMP-binding protein [Acidimicrobiia bacterium]